MPKQARIGTATVHPLTCFMYNQNYLSCNHVFLRGLVSLVTLLLQIVGTAQQTPVHQIQTFSIVELSKLQHKTHRWAAKLEQVGRQNIKLLHQWEEHTAIALPNNVHVESLPAPLPDYDSLKRTAAQSSLTHSFYSGRLDSLNTALGFLQLGQGKQSSLGALFAATRYDLDNLYDQLNAGVQANSFLFERLAQLELLPRAVLPKRILRRYQKQLSRYNRRIAAFQALVERPDHGAALLLSEVQKFPEFASFFAKNARLSQLFPLPDPDAAEGQENMHSGLQTRAALAQSFKDRYGRTADLSAELQRNLQSVAGINSLADLVIGHSPGEPTSRQVQAISAHNDRPGKGYGTLKKRIVPGINLQSTPARHFFPAISDVGLNLGYKISQRSAIGIGGSYKLGLGQSWDNIKLTHEGLSLRTFIDVQLKGSVYISGGYEQHYRRAINTIAAFKGHSAWQSSGLIGLSKRYRVGNVDGNMQLMWDVLSYRQVPKTQPIIWRIGYMF